MKDLLIGLLIGFIIGWCVAIAANMRKEDN
jgi:gas vesicle protein